MGQLLNIPIFEATRRVCKGGGISFKGVFVILFYYLQIIFSLPLVFLQFLLFSKKISKTIIPKDPVFILGHYRSGTTYLHKLMASDRQFGVLTNYDALFANSNLLFGSRMQRVFQRVIHLFKIRNPFFNNSVVLLSEPTEEDDYLMNKVSAYSAYWGLVFPKHWREWLNGSPQFENQAYCEGWKREYLETVKFTTFKSKGKQLVLKSPPNTERISYLLQMFPRAKFIYIYRNPFHMYHSIRNMWKKAILGYYSVQKISEEELDDIVFGHYSYLADRYERDKGLIPEGNLIEVAYEALKADPAGVMRTIYTELELPGYESTAGDLQRQLDKEKEYQNFQYQHNDPEIKKIEEKWGKYIRRWHYH
jgi:hypothetical protein